MSFIKKGISDDSVFAVNSRPSQTLAIGTKFSDDTGNVWTVSERKNAESSTFYLCLSQRGEQLSMEEHSIFDGIKTGDFKIIFTPEIKTASTKEVVPSGQEIIEEKSTKRGRKPKAKKKEESKAEVVDSKNKSLKQQGQESYIFNPSSNQDVAPLPKLPDVNDIIPMEADSEGNIQEEGKVKKVKRIK